MERPKILENELGEKVIAAALLVGERVVPTVIDAVEVIVDKGQEINQKIQDFLGPKDLR